MQVFYQIGESWRGRSSNDLGRHNNDLGRHNYGQPLLAPDNKESQVNQDGEDGGKVFNPLSVESLESQTKWPLLIALLMLIGYLLTGFLLGRVRYGWSLTDSCYFVVMTLTTVGYGDKTFPVNDRILGGVFAFFGVAYIGWAAGIVMSYLGDNAVRAALSIRTAQQTIQAVDDDHSPDHELELKLRQLHWNFRKCIIEIILICFFGTAVMMYAENWDFDMAFYWACVTMTTVGYGDVVPTMDTTKCFTAIYALVSLVYLATAVGYMTNIPFEVQKLRHINKVLTQFGNSLEQEELDAVFNSEVLFHLRNPKQREGGKLKPSVTRSEFALWMLVMQGKVGLEDIDPCNSVFDQLDPDGNGSLDAADVTIFLAKRKEMRKSLSNTSDGESPMARSVDMNLEYDEPGHVSNDKLRDVAPQGGSMVTSPNGMAPNGVSLSKNVLISKREFASASMQNGEWNTILEAGINRIRQAEVTTLANGFETGYLGPTFATEPSNRQESEFHSLGCAGCVRRDAALRARDEALLILTHHSNPKLQEVILKMEDSFK